MPTFPRTSLRDLAEGAQRLARAVPALAASLSRPVSDPITERLVEGVSLISATVLDKTHDAQQSAYELVAERCAPWLRRPIPAAAIVAFDPPTHGRVIVPSTSVLTSAPIDGIECTFRPIRDVVLSPYRVDAAGIEGKPGRPSTVRILLRATGIEPLNPAFKDGISLYFGGAREGALRILFALTSGVARAVIEAPGWPQPIVIDPAAIVRSELDPLSRASTGSRWTAASVRSVRRGRRVRGQVPVRSDSTGASVSHSASDRSRHSDISTSRNGTCRLSAARWRCPSALRTCRESV